MMIWTTMSNIKKEWRWMDKYKEPTEDHPYYDSKSKKHSYTLAVFSMLCLILTIIGLAICQYIHI